MSVNPGFGGQRFIPRALHKVGAVRDLLGPGKTFVDLGATPGTKIKLIDHSEAVRR